MIKYGKLEDVPHRSELAVKTANPYTKTFFIESLPQSLPNNMIAETCDKTYDTLIQEAWPIETSKYSTKVGMAKFTMYPSKRTKNMLKAKARTINPKLLGLKAAVCSLLRSMIFNISQG